MKTYIMYNGGTYLIDIENVDNLVKCSNNSYLKSLGINELDEEGCDISFIYNPDGTMSYVKGYSSYHSGDPTPDPGLSFCNVSITNFKVHLRLKLPEGGGYAVGTYWYDMYAEATLDDKKHHLVTKTDWSVYNGDDFKPVSFDITDLNVSDKDKNFTFQSDYNFHSNVHTDGNGFSYLKCVVYYTLENGSSGTASAVHKFHVPEPPSK